MTQGESKIVLDLESGEMGTVWLMEYTLESALRRSSLHGKQLYRTLSIHRLSAKIERWEILTKW